MKKRGLVFFIIIIIIVALVFIVLKKRNSSSEVESKNDTVVTLTSEMDHGILCVYNLNNYYVIDKNKNVISNYSTKPADLPLVTGLDFDTLYYGNKAETTNEVGFEYVINVALNLEKQNLNIQEINVSEYNEIILIYNNLKVELGRNTKTEEKISDLNDMFNEVSDLNGTLHMQDANANNYGYTFKQN